MNYTYDGDMQRVKKSSGKLYWYGVHGEVLFETDLSGNNPTEYVFFGGRRIARRDASGTVYYFFRDHLQSLRVITNATGGVVRDIDYNPWGWELCNSGSVDDPNRFADMLLDSESGLYHTLYRKYSPTFGRWFSTDPVRCCVKNPQGLNLYPYVVNNPTNLTDPRGDQLEVWLDALSSVPCPPYTAGCWWTPGDPYGTFGGNPWLTPEFWFSVYYGLDMYSYVHGLGSRTVDACGVFGWSRHPQWAKDCNRLPREQCWRCCKENEDNLTHACNSYYILMIDAMCKSCIGEQAQNCPLHCPRNSPQPPRPSLKLLHQTRARRPRKGA